MLRLTLLGGLRVSRAATPDVAVPGQQAKRLALLGYLAVARPRGPHRRDTIVALLWPELDASRARAALRQSIHALRKALGGETLVSDGAESIELSASSVSCDVWDLESAAQRGDHARAVALYTGTLFEGLFVSDAPAFEHWLDGERQRLRALVQKSAWRAAEREREDGHSSEVVTHVRAALALGDFDEQSIRRSMRMLAAIGDRASALAVYERFAGDLRRELEVEPSSETLALAAELRAPTTPRTTVSPASAGLGSSQVRGTEAPAAPRVRSWPGSPVAIAAGLGLLAVFLAAPLAPSDPAEIDPRRVRIERFANETGLRAFDALARNAEIAVRAAAGDMEHVSVVAGDNEVGTVVRGTIRLVGDSIDIRAEIVSQSSGDIVRTVARRFAPHGMALTLDQFGGSVGAALAAALYPGWGNALSLPSSYNGYRLFVDGMRRIKLEQHDEAIAAFRRAFTEDSAFTAAALLAGAELYQIGRFAAADSIAIALTPRRAFLPSVDAHLLDWLTRSLRGDRIGARNSMEAVAALAPDAELAWLQLAIDNLRTARPREALDALDRLDPPAESGDGWAAYWAARADAFHLLGDFARELATVRQGLRLHPDLQILLTYELRALAALGRLPELERLAVLVAEQPRANGTDAPTTMRMVALELAAHGNRDASRAMLWRGLEWYDARSIAERSTLSYRAGRARTLYLLDDRAGARAIYEELSGEQPGCLDCVGALGVLAARERDSAAVLQHAGMLSEVARPFLFGRNQLWLARMDAALGDSAAAVARLTASFAAGTEFSVMTHADGDLRAIAPERVYRVLARQ